MEQIESLNGNLLWGNDMKVRTCVLNMPLNEGQGHPHDSSGYGNNGTNYGADWVSGDFGWALEFSGGSSSDYIQIPDDDTLDITDTLTICSWMKFTSDGGILTKDEPGGQRSYSHRIAQHYFNFLANSPGNVTGQRKSAATLTFDTWYFLVSVYDGSAQSIDMYVNGSLSNGVISGTIPSSIKITTTPVVIGQYYNYAVSKLAGTIAGVLVNNRLWSSTEITAYWNATKARYGYD